MKLISISILLAYLLACNRPQKNITGLEGNPLPSFNLMLPDSTTDFNTANIPAGRPIVLFYFGPYCPYSRAEMEDIISNMKTLKNIQFCIFTTAQLPEMRMFYDHYRLKTFPNVVTGIDYTNFFSQYFKTPGVPYLALYNSHKRLKEVLIGKSDISALKNIAME